MLRNRIQQIRSSPTLATWCNQGAQLSKFLIITPILLVKFDEAEIACWLLFASLNVFGVIVASRLAVAFARMIAFAMAGATDLSPIQHGHSKRGDGRPNWERIKAAYSTLGCFQWGSALACGIVAWLMGEYGLHDLLQDSPDPEAIRIAFLIFIVSNVIIFAEGRYAVTLTGINKVALINWFNAAFSMASVLVGALVLLLDGGIVPLSLGMQGVNLLGVIRNRWILLYQCDEGRNLRQIHTPLFDKQIAKWALQVALRSTAGMLVGTGLVQVSGIVVARHFAPAEAASYLLATRIAAVITTLGDVPFYSQVPKFARWLSEGRLGELRGAVISRLQMANIFQVGVYIFVGVTAAPALRLLGSAQQFISTEMWLVFGGCMILSHFAQLSLSTASIGNHFVMAIEQTVVFVLGCVAMMFSLRFGLWGLVGGVFLPQLALFPLGAVRYGANFVNMTPTSYIGRSFVPAFGAYVVLAGLTEVVNKVFIHS